ncbi:hypothetical protein ElyMa_003040000 [Elysia marginata]|uniref:Uncharacterized protein n=1 Tax=Elysia marginata TaxID=1093978 RepID=A0AAV4IHS6_9GAST|nr:hypothetical protein ElyMa_003040000 [Elysia marginata]
MLDRTVQGQGRGTQQASSMSSSARPARPLKLNPNLIKPDLGADTSRHLANIPSTSGVNIDQPLKYHCSGPGRPRLK